MSSDVEYWLINIFEGIHVAYEEHVKTDSTACVFSVEGVVRDSLRLSDAYDLSQLAKVECIKPGPFRWR